MLGILNKSIIKVFIAFIIIYCSLFNIAKAQKQGQLLIDSLENIIKTQRINDTTQILILADLCREYRNMNPDVGLKYGFEAEKLARKLNFKKGLGLIYWGMSSCYLFKSNRINSYDCLVKSTKINEEINNYDLLSNIYLTYPFVLVNLNPEKVNYYIEKAKQNLPKIHDYKSYVSSLGMIGNVYINMYTKNGKVIKDSVIHYLNKALYGAKKYNLKYDIGLTYIRLGNFYLTNNIDSALYYYQKGEPYILEANAIRLLSESYYSLTSYYVYQYIQTKSEFDKNEALKYAEKSYNYANQVGYLLYKANIFEQLYYLYKSQNNIKMAFYYLDAFHYLDGSLNNSSKLTELNNKYFTKELELRDSKLTIQNLKLKEKDTFIWAGSGFLILILALISILYMLYRKKKHLNKILYEKNAQIEDANSELNELNQNLSQKNIEINLKKDEIEKTNNLISSDIQKAAEYVTSLLPIKIDNNSLISTDWLFIPSSKLGGDAFGYHWLDKDHFAFYLLDVCGHGIGAALHSVTVLHVLKTSSLLNVNPREPESVLSSLNNSFQMSDHNDMYFSMWYGVYNINTKILNYACAGHPVPLMLSDSKTTTFLDTGDLLIGIIPNIVYKKASVEVTNKSVIYLFSDGVYEIFKSDGEELSINEFYNILIENSINTKNELSILNEKLKAIQSSDLFIDDFSIMKVILQ